MNTKTEKTALDKMFQEMEQIDFYEQQADELMNELEVLSEQLPTIDPNTIEGQFRFKLNLWAEANEQLAVYYKRLAGADK